MRKKISKSGNIKTKRLYKILLSAKDKVKAAEEVLQEHRKELELIIELIDKGVASKNTNHLFESGNERGKFVCEVVKDAVNDAEQTLQQFNIKIN